MDRQASPRTRKEGTQPDRECCTASHTLTESELASDVQILTALGNDTRYEVLRLIADTEDEVCGCELEPVLGVSQSAVSQSLSRLYAAGLVSRRKDGRWRYYTTTPRAMAILRTLDGTRGESDE
jgi:ArsR family transcriptional regulator